MKRTIAIVAGGDSSELVVSLRSAQGLYSFIDKERYNLYIVEMEGHRWGQVSKQLFTNCLYLLK